MDNTIQKLIRPIYSELKGILSQAPNVDKYLYSQEKALWERFNSLLNKLSVLTKDESYKEFILEPNMVNRFPNLSAAVYRGKVSGLISRLYGTFFTQELEPFSGSPSTVVTQTSNQTVTTQLYVQLGIDLKSALDKTENINEKSFIGVLTEKIGEVKNYIDFLLLVIGTAAQFGITLDRIGTLFGK